VQESNMSAIITAQILSDTIFVSLVELFVFIKLILFLKLLR
jgi:hypothetical protein